MVAEQWHEHRRIKLLVNRDRRFDEIFVTVSVPTERKAVLDDVRAWSDDRNAKIVGTALVIDGPPCPWRATWVIERTGEEGGDAASVARYAGGTASFTLPARAR